MSITVAILVAAIPFQILAIIATLWMRQTINSAATVLAPIVKTLSDNNINIHINSAETRKRVVASLTAAAADKKLQHEISEKTGIPTLTKYGFELFDKILTGI